MKGDRVETVVDAGDATRTYEVVASRAGRRVETAVRRGVVEVSEVTRWGSPPHALEAVGEGPWSGPPASWRPGSWPSFVEQPVPREDSSEKPGRTGHPLREDPEPQDER